MQIDISTVLVDLRGEPLRSAELVHKLTPEGEKIPLLDENGEQRKDGEGEPLWQMEQGKITLKDVILNALTNVPPATQGQNRQPISGKEHHRRYHLAQKVFRAEQVVAIEADDIALIKDLIPKVYGAPLLIGQTFDLLDPMAPPAEEPAEAAEA